MASPPGALVGVGVGPGDPELLTLRALRVLRECDRVLAPTIAPDAMGRAESVLRRADPALRVERLVFAIQGDAASQAEAHDRAAARVATHLDAGERVAFVTLGDPNVYSTFTHLAGAVRRVRPEARVETVPGIMAFQDLAARAGVSVLDGSDRLALVTATDDLGAFDRAVGDAGAAVVVYKGGGRLPEMAARLERAGRLDGAVYGELLGLEGERIGRVAEHADLPATYLATVIVPPRPRPGGPR